MINLRKDRMRRLELEREAPKGEQVADPDFLRNSAKRTEMPSFKKRKAGQN